MPSAISDHPDAMPALLDRLLVTRRPYVLLLLLCLALWLPGFFTLPAADRDESRFVQAAKQMIETGDYVRIRNGLTDRNQKPIGIYWMQVPFASAARALGLAQANPVWPYRLPSLLGGMIAVATTYGFGRRWFAPRAAMLAAILLAASMILAIEVHTAKTDAALLAATTIAMGLLGRAYLEPQRFSARSAATFWAALGVAVLLKGPIAPMVAVLTTICLVVSDLRQGRPAWLRALRWTRGVWLLLAIALPWFIAIGWSTHGRFFAQSVGGDLGGKLMGSDDAHGAPLGMHLLMMSVLLFGGAIPVWCGLPRIWSARRQPAVRFLIAWVLPSWLVFECVATKLPHYTLPLYPPLALLGADWLLSGARCPAWLGKTAIALAAVASLLIGLAALALPFIARAGLHWADLLGVPTFAVALALLTALAHRWPDPRGATLCALAAAPLLIWTILAGELPALQPLWIAPQVEAELRAHWPGTAPAFATLGFTEPSLMFVCGTQTTLLDDANAAVQFLAGHPHQAVLVDDRDNVVFTQRAIQSGLAPALVSQIAGYNYSRGRRIVVFLYTD